jgi:hypothetical protein
VDGSTFTKRDCFLQALRCDPKYTNAWLQLGIGLSEPERVDVAGETFTRTASESTWCVAAASGPRLPSSSSSGGTGAAAGLGESSTTSGPAPQLTERHSGPSRCRPRIGCEPAPRVHARVARICKAAGGENELAVREMRRGELRASHPVLLRRRSETGHVQRRHEKKSPSLSLTGSASAIEDGTRLKGRSVDGADGAVAAMAAASAPDEHLPTNAPSRTWCFVCSTDRPADGGGKPAGDGSSGQSANALLVCRTCLLANPRSARFCICGERQPSPEEMDALERGLGLKPPKPTEWACTHCTMLNFVRRERCARCGKPKNVSEVSVRVGIASRSS